MTRRAKQRLRALGLALFGLAVATTLALLAFQDNITLFQTPSDVAANRMPEGRVFRLGGLVENDSVKRSADGLTTDFTVTDKVSTMRVTYTGHLPDLFREGQGVVAQGRLRADGVFAADEVLAKHDETYMPPEVAKGLKRAGEMEHETTSLERGK